jgi:PmbA protein
VIAGLIELAGRRTTLADAALKTDETTSVRFAGGRLASASTRRSQGVNLRVVAEGRMGFAGTHTEDAPALLESALASAREGEAASVTLPRPTTQPPRVFTHSPRAATATVADLVQLGSMIRDRLAAEGAELGILIERSIGSVMVANTRGVDAGYDVTLVSVTVDAARIRDGRRVVLQGNLSGVELPSITEIETLIARLSERLAWARRDAEAEPGRQLVGFLPSAMPLLLQPVEQALLGKTVLQGSSPLGRRRGSRVFSAELTLRDDPLVDGRAGSRPVDDEGVPSRVTPLVQAGQVEAFLYDLETATRMGVPPTGHGRRTTFAKPQPAWSNVVVEPGPASFEELLAAIGDGLLIEETYGSPAGNAAGGTFAQTATVAWRVSRGEVQGLAREVTIAGNAHDLLGRVAALGRDSLWIGSRSVPTVVVEGCSVF